MTQPTVIRPPQYTEHPVANITPGMWRRNNAHTWLIQWTYIHAVISLWAHDYAYTYMLIPSLGDGSTNLAAVMEKKNASEEINSEWIFSLIPAVRQSLPLKQVITSFLERLLSQDTLVLTEISLERCDIMAEKSTSQFPISDFASTFLLKKDSFQSESAKEYC